MHNLLKLENIRFREGVSDWKEAIEVSIRPLVDQGYCEERYIDAVIESTNQYGPYYVLCEDFALIHAGSDQGVIKTQLAVTILKNPIKFKEDGYNVRILIALASESPDAHLTALQAISKIFSDPAQVEKMATSTSAEDVYNMFLEA